MVNTLVVERERILLGDIDLEVFRLPDLSYMLSQTQSAEAVKKLELSIRQFLASKSPYALPYKSFTPVKGKVKGEKTSVNLIPIPLASSYWVKEAVGGNVTAGFLLAACTAESIERRADRVYGVQKSEEVYNQMLAEIRNAGVVTRKRLTDTILAYIARNKITGNKAKFLICNTTKKINKLLFDKTAKKIQEEGGKVVTRDNLSFFELRDLENLENAACALIEKKNCPPEHAVEVAYGLISSFGGMKKAA